MPDETTMAGSMKKALLTGIAVLFLATGTAHAGEGTPADEALIDIWERTKILPAPDLAPVRPGLIWVFRPPPEYDKPFDGLVVIQEFRGEEMKGACFRRGFACAEFVTGNPAVCTCMSSEHFGQLAWQFKRMSGSSGLKVQAAMAC